MFDKHTIEIEWAGRPLKLETGRIARQADAAVLAQYGETTVLATVVAVKTAIPWGFLLLIPALAATGGSGFALASGRRAGLTGAKIRRMPLVAGNGILVLIPAALFLATTARAAEFDRVFYAVQALELVAGAANIALLGLNMRDGLRMAGRLRRPSAPSL